MNRGAVLIAGLLGALGVGIGAYAAHSLEARLAGHGIDADHIAQKLEQCDVAVRYHLIHVLAVLALGLLGTSMAARRRAFACGAFTLGIALFSGGLYSMVFFDRMGHWAIVPSGGLCFILGWIAVAAMACCTSASRDGD